MIFDYGSALSPQSIRIVPCALFITGLIAATAWALINKPSIGFLGTTFFAILAPSSSIVPVATKTMAEHWMFLPLVPVIVLVVAGIHRLLGRATLPCCLVLAAGLFWATWQRNEAYCSGEGIWSDTVAKLPANERAHNNLGSALSKVRGHLNQAVTQFEEAVRLKPDYAEAHYNLGNALNSLGRTPEAVAQFNEAVRLRPDYVVAHYNLRNALNSMGRTPEAIA